MTIVQSMILLVQVHVPRVHVGTASNVPLPSFYSSRRPLGQGVGRAAPAFKGHSAMERSSVRILGDGHCYPSGDGIGGNGAFAYT